MITVKYHVRVDFRYRTEDMFSDSTLDDDLLNVHKEATVFTGNPACFPYVLVECDTQEEATETEKLIKQILEDRHESGMP